MEAFGVYANASYADSIFADLRQRRAEPFTIDVVE